MIVDEENDKGELEKRLVQKQMRMDERVCPMGQGAAVDVDV